VLLLNEMLAEKVRPADLARLMGIKPQEVNRIVDLEHPTKIDTLAAAFTALGRELDLVVR
jgi:antitoxin HicB